MAMTSQNTVFCGRGWTNTLFILSSTHTLFLKSKEMPGGREGNGKRAEVIGQGPPCLVSGRWRAQGSGKEGTQRAKTALPMIKMLE